MELFGKLRKIAEKTKALKVNAFAQIIFSDNEAKAEVIRLNTDEQLFNKGVDSTSTPLDQIGLPYAAKTVLIKKDQGLPFDRVTLFDTGEFYESFRVEAEKDGIVIFADTIKGGEDLRERWGNDIIGLTDESIAELVLFVRDYVKENFVNILL